MRAFLKTLLIVVIAISVFLTVAVIFGSMYLSGYKDSHVEEALLEFDSRAGSTEFYCFGPSDRYGALSKAKRIDGATLDNGIKYEYVSFKSIPENLINAFIAIEDKRFYSHSGIDYLRTGKAAVNYVFGNGDFGGSTITQQLVKNLTEYDDFSVKRKLTEAFSALDLENNYDKTEILEMYLNVINLSEGCRGIGAAAELFYSKTPQELTLSECATVAAITNNPAKYDPLKYPENNKKRRDLVLKCMLEQGYIGNEEYLQAMNEPIQLNLSNKYKSGSVNSWYIDMVTEDVLEGLCERYGITKKSASLMLYRGGFKIYTAMDENIQGILDGYYSDEYNFPIGENGELPQSAMIIIDPYNGDILGVAGAVGNKTANRLQNYATQVKRPPGSTIKPLSVYAPALDRGLIKWSTVIEDSPVNDGGGRGLPWPQNVTRTYVGNVDIKYAVEHSLNTVAVKVLGMLGVDESFDFLTEKLYWESLDAEKDIGLASLGLGQPTRGVTLRELTAAYSIFQEGIMSRARSYYFVTDARGNIILGNALEQGKAISAESAAIMTKMLEAVVDTGTAAGKIGLDEGVSVAGKSGTSNNNCDRYFIGYTPELLAGVWMGYEYPKDLSEFGGNISVYIWDEVMSRIYEGDEWGSKTKFSVPNTVQRLTYREEGDTLSYSEGWFEVGSHK